MSQYCDHFDPLFNDSDDHFIGFKEVSGGGGSGGDGGYYRPSVSSDGTLSWTPSSSAMPPVASQNIKGPTGNSGPQGPKGDTGPAGPQGEAGSGFVIKGYYFDIAALESEVPSPETGAAYGVGASDPFDIYVWDADHRVWVNNGKLQGAKGDDGARGVTFTPSVESNGNLSWCNDGGLENPETVNIMGEKGDKGDKGDDGKSPYQAACEAGYTGTEQTFNAALTSFPYHNVRHLPDGADPITVKTGNIEDNAVTTGKIANGAVSRSKLAQDALAGRVKVISSSNYNIVADDIDTTLLINANSATVVLSKAVADAFPDGTTIAIFPFDNGNGNGVAVEATGMRFYLPGATSAGVGGIGKTAKFKIAETYTLIALQKMVANAAYGDVWTIQGNVEVV